MQRIHRNDKVVVISGKDRGKTGRVIKVLPKESRVVIEGINVVTKHKKPRREQEIGQRFQMEAPIHWSNVQLADPKDGKPTRVGVKVDKDGKKTRVAIRSGEEIAIVSDKEAKE